MKLKFRQFTEREAQIAVGFSMANLAVQFVAGRILLKHVANVEKRAKGLYDVTKDLERISFYQRHIINKAGYSDQFDQIAVEQLDADLKETLTKLAKIYNIDPNKLWDEATSSSEESE